MVSKTLNGFRAVRYCDSRRIYYVTERDDGYVAISDDGAVRLLVELKAFPVTFCHEHRPEMPPVVRARFEGKPTFAEWWADRKQKENADEEERRKADAVAARVRAVLELPVPQEIEKPPTDSGACRE